MRAPLVLHCSATRESHGGIQSLLACHHAHDAEAGFRPRFISCFDRRTTWPGDCRTLASHGWETVGALRRRFAEVARTPSADVTVYHDGWGVNWFAPLDSAARRVVFLHTEVPHLDELVRVQAPQVDGFLSVSQAMADHVRRLVPDFPAERLCVLPPFVEPPPGLATRGSGPHAPGGELLLGYAGRMEAAHKRLDRLPALLAELDRRKVAYVFELLGDGSYEPSLRRQLAGNPRVKFLGWRQGGEYWSVVGRWRALVLLSDYEGASRAGMEAMVAGVLPIHPAFSPAAAELLGPVAAHGLYPVGDVAAAAGRIADLAALAPAAQDKLADQCRAVMAGRTRENYLAVYRQFVNGLLAAPPRATVLSPPRWHDWLPVGIYTRMFPRQF